MKHWLYIENVLGQDLPEESGTWLLSWDTWFCPSKCHSDDVMDDVIFESFFAFIRLFWYQDNKSLNSLVGSHSVLLGNKCNQIELIDIVIHLWFNLLYAFKLLNNKIYNSTIPGTRSWSDARLDSASLNKLKLKIKI